MMMRQLAGSLAAPQTGLLAQVGSHAPVTSPGLSTGSLLGQLGTTAPSSISPATAQQPGINGLLSSALSNAAPAAGLLGAAQNYSYPLTNGLMSSLSSALPSAANSTDAFTPSAQTPTDWTQVALQLAGNPHAGPYATNLGQVPAATGTTGTAGTTGTTSSPSTASTVGSALLGLGEQLGNPNSALTKAVQGLLNPSMSATDAANWASGAPADQAVNQQLGNAAQNDGTAQSVQASNDAALQAQNAIDAYATGAPADAAVTSQLGNVANDGTAAAVQASNNAALAGATPATSSLLGSLASYASGAPADAAVQAALGNVANDGTGAAVQAANDAALNATDGGAAGAGAGASSGVLGDATQIAGGLGAAYSLYNEIKNYQSGATGSDALNGAETGAAIGSVFPVIGTALGGLIGGAAGALSSAFGGGENDPETLGWDKTVQAAQSDPSVISSLPASTLYQDLAGVMDAKDNSAGHSQPIEQVFGRAGESNLLSQLTNYVNQQYQAGAITPGESIQDQWTNTVAPWLASKGASIANDNTAQGAPEGSALTSLLQGLLGDWEQGQFGTPIPNTGTGLGSLLNYAGLTPQQVAGTYSRLPLTEQPKVTSNPQLASMIAKTAAYKKPLNMT